MRILAFLKHYYRLSPHISVCRLGGTWLIAAAALREKRQRLRLNVRYCPSRIAAVSLSSGFGYAAFPVASHLSKYFFRRSVSSFAASHSAAARCIAASAAALSSGLSSHQSANSDQMA